MWLFLIGFVTAITCYDLLFMYIRDNYFIIFIVTALAIYGYLNCRAVLTFIIGALIGILLTYSYLDYYKTTINKIPIAKAKVIGDIATVPSFNKMLCRFVVHTSKINNNNIVANINTSWFSPQGCAVKAGEKWQMFLKIKQLNGSYSPRVGDYAKNAMIMNRHASAYVIKDKYNKVVVSTAVERSYFSYYFLKLQDSLWHKYENICPSCKHKGLVAALLFGMSDKIDPEIWPLFQNTGTSHLFAISGLHVGIVGMMFFYMARLLWSANVKNTAYIASPYISSLAALLAALFYCAISGFGVPALRCVIMLGFFLVLKLCQTRIIAWKVLLLTSCVIGLFWPPLFWSKGFLLSFFAVLILIFSSYTKMNKSTLYNKYLHAQLMITIGLLPFIVLFWHKIVLASMPTNILAIPLFSIIIVPLSFILMILLPFHDIAALLAKFIDSCLAFLLNQLYVISHLKYNIIKISDLNNFEYSLIFLGAILLLMPAGMPGRLLGWVFWLPMLLPNKLQHINYGDFSVSFLDVGQGTAVLVSTHKHSLLFDTGPAFAGGYSAGEKVIWPYIEYLALPYLDYVVISHPDSDHKGGLAKLKNYVNIKHGYSTDLTLFAKNIGEKCRGGQVWYADGVKFEFVWPLDEKKLSKNNNSCVLRVSNAASSLLLTGDIEKKAEALLLAQNSKLNLQSDILLAPHHGSKGASSLAFINNIAPKYVIFTTGKNNKFGFPHSEVLARYNCNDKVLCLNTADTGTIMFRQTRHSWQVETWRGLNRHVWLDSMHGMYMRDTKIFK
jgi:competence protein ComEC